MCDINSINPAMATNYKRISLDQMHGPCCTSFYYIVQTLIS